MLENGSLLKIKDLRVLFPLEKTFLDRLFAGKKLKYVHAVDGVDLSIKEGETLGLVGESGSGKSTLGLSIIALVSVTNGNIYFKNDEITNIDRKERRGVLKHIQMVFQNPYSSLNPTMKIQEIIGRQFKISNIKYSEKDIKEKVTNILLSVGLRKEDISKYPHEFSGGQKQRISLARALAPNPEFLIADEITSALDVSIQSQILSLLLKFKEENNLSMLYITHDLRVARLITDRIAVMYLGKIVEYGKTKEIFKSPYHPYTKALLTAIPRNEYKDTTVLEGSVPSAVNPPEGCHLYNRCPSKMDICKKIYPTYIEVEEEHFVACHLYENS